MEQTQPNRLDKQQDINAKIINLVKIRGPILPIHAAKETGQTLLISGAFLSSLTSDKTLKISNLKVGGSPLYYLPGQEAMLENFIRFLNHKEREAFLLLKEKKIVKDSELTPDLRVAIRNIGDFASSFQLNLEPDVLYWRLYNLTDEEIEKEMEKFRITPEQPKLIEQEKPEIKAELKIEEKKIEPETKQIEPIFSEKPKIKRERAKPEKFLEELKQILKTKEIELINVEKYDKKEVIARIMLPSKKACLLIAIDKKRVTEEDLLKAYKKSQQYNLPYMILTRTESSKRLKETIDAFKSLEKIEKLE